MGETDTFGITLPIRDWRTLFSLAERADRAPSDLLRVLIREAARQHAALHDHEEGRDAVHA